MITVYYGADAGCGCTMLAQSTANLIAKNNLEKRVLLLNLSGQPGTEYSGMDFNYSIDDIHIKLKSKVLSICEFESVCSIKNNLYILQGSKNLKQRKEYMPEEIKSLLELVESNFDYVIIDAGSSIYLGLGIGALMYGGRNILVTTQSKLVMKRFLQKQSLFNKLNIKFEGLIINKYISKHFLSNEKEVKASYEIEECQSLEYSAYGMQAENDWLTIENFDKEYEKGLKAITNIYLDGDLNNVLPKNRAFGFFRRR